MDPLTILAGIKLGSSILSTVGGLSQGSEDAAAQRLAAERAQANARAAIRKGESDVGMVRRQGGRVMGAQRAAIAQSGLGTGGTNAALMAESARNMETDVTNTRMEAALRAADAADQARQFRQQASNTKKASYIGAASNILSTASRFYGG